MRDEITDEPRSETAARDGVGAFAGRIGATIADSEPAWPAPVTAPLGTPNVVYVIFDDVGFSDFSCFGSEISTPHLDALAAGGLRYTNFHTTGLCSATRAALLTGRNHHRVGMGTLADWDLGFPGARGRVTRAAGTLAELLGPQGWNTFAVGKWHLTPMRETTGAGPYTDWPTNRGFDRFYGFFDGETNHWQPELTHDNHRIAVPARTETNSRYHLTEDLIDRAIGMVRDQKSVAPEKPFFLNLAFGACHAPHQVDRSFIDPYVEVFADGYDAARQRRLARQIESGVVPAGTELTPRHRSVKPWAELDDDRRRTFVRLQAAYAGMLSHTDRELGRFVAFLDEIGQLDNTVLFVLSDNGASQEGSPLGTTNSLKMANGIRDSVAANLADIELIGTEVLNNNYPLGWAMAGNTPLKRFKQNVHGGGVRDPLIIHWPHGVPAGQRGSLRTQFVHAVDLTPTVLELVGVAPPESIGGTEQLPFDGTPISDTFAHPDHARRSRPQIFELFGHRAIWEDGWKAVGFHEPGTEFSDDEWELYHLDADMAENTDLAATHPDKLAELTERWWELAHDNQVLPLDDRRFNERWVLSGGGTQRSRRRHVYWRGQAHLPSDACPDIRNRSYTIEAAVEVDESSQGVLVAHGDRACGYTLYVKDGHLVHDYNRAGTHTVVRSTTAIASGRRRLAYRFTKTGDHRGLGELLVDDVVVGSAPIDETLPLVLSFEGLDVGADELVSVTDAYEAPFAFTGSLDRVVYTLEPVAEGAAAGRPGGAAEYTRQ